MSLLTKKQAQKLQELVYMDDASLLNELSGVAGEIVLRCAQARDRGSREKLYDALGAMQALMEFYACINEEAGWHLPERATASMDRLKAQCEAGETPTLILDDSANQWDG